ncbi:MAG: transposase [Candidatus Tectomicrobia bacterium]|nr:transposase [Candidatus Tectomicrobia bacterium]
MIKAHKIRLHPTPEQEVYFRKAAGTARFVYNWGLAEWKRHKAEHPGQEHGAMALKKGFNALKLEQFPWVYEVAKDVAEGAFTNLSAALKNYCESKNGKRKGKKVGFPTFKSKKNKRQSFRLNNDRIGVADHALYVPKLGWVNMTESLRFTGRMMGAVVSRQAGRWSVSIAVEMEKPKPKEFEKPSVGVDVGIKTLMMLSDDRQYENQVLLRAELKHLKRLSRRLSRRKLGSQRWEKAKGQLERFHQRIACRRADSLHKATTEIASTYEVVGIEDLNVEGMMKNHRLALSLSDVAFGEIRRQLTYKSHWLSGRVVAVDTFYPSSRRCSRCGTINHELTLEDREWTCQHCGTLHDRDRNAAVNIEVEALRMLSQPPVVATSGSRLVDGM